jgi:hypothetical protein
MSLIRSIREEGQQQWLRSETSSVSIRLLDLAPRWPEGGLNFEILAYKPEFWLTSQNLGLQARILAYKPEILAFTPESWLTSQNPGLQARNLGVNARILALKPGSGTHK